MLQMQTRYWFFQDKDSRGDMIGVAVAHGTFLKPLDKINLRKQTLAYIFASKYLHMEARRDVYQAIADPTRRAIITMIASEPHNVNSIAEKFDVTRQAISL